MIDLIFPDGSTRQFEPGVTGKQVAASIAVSLAKRARADQAGRRTAGRGPRRSSAAASSRSSTRDAPEALETIRHDVSHILAEAVQELFPGTQVTIGPAIEDGFYYDFARDEPFSLDDLAKIEQRMKEIVDRDEPIVREVWDRDEAIAHFKSIGEHYKAEIIGSIPAGEDVTRLSPGQVEGPVPRAAPAVDEGGRQGVQADQAGRRLLARRPPQPDAAADLRHGLGQRGRPRRLPAPHRGGREARPPQDRPGHGPLPHAGRGQGDDLLAPQGLDALPHGRGLHAPPPGRRRLCRGQGAADHGPGAVGEVRPLGEVRQEHVHLRDGGGREPWPSSR